jgi:catechol 2,3-dioxygenase-like lactoylglutathione lyase family enzyme
MSLKVQGFDHLVINVQSVAVSADWYQRVLGMQRDDGSPGGGKAPRTAVKFGRHKINLRPVTASKEEWFTADHETAGSQDLCFLTSSDPEDVVAHLRQCGVGIEVGPVQRKGAQGTIRSVYCRDPDGNLIEIASYA